MFTNILPASVRDALLRIIPDPGHNDPRFIEPARILEALAFQAKTGCAWRDLPACYPCKSTVLLRRKAWIQAGVFEDFLEQSLSPMGDNVIVDATFVECKSPLLERGWTKIGDGLKLQVLSDFDGRISALSLGSARPSESSMLKDLLKETSSPLTILGDSAYAGKDFVADLAVDGYRMITTGWYGRSKTEVTSEMAEARKQRWVIERCFAWLKSWRAIATCWARSLDTYWVGLTLAIANVNARFTSKVNH